MGIEYCEVESRILQACRTERADRARVGPKRLKSFWVITSDDPDVAYGYTEIRTPPEEPTPEQVTDYEVAMSWTRGISKAKWRFIWWRSFGMSFRRMSDFIHASEDTAERRYKEAMREVHFNANSPSRLHREKAKVFEKQRRGMLPICYWPKRGKSGKGWCYQGY